MLREAATRAKLETERLYTLDISKVDFDFVRLVGAQELRTTSQFLLPTLSFPGGTVCSRLHTVLSKKEQFDDISVPPVFWSNITAVRTCIKCSVTNFELKIMSSRWTRASCR